MKLKNLRLYFVFNNSFAYDILTEQKRIDLSYYLNTIKTFVR